MLFQRFECEIFEWFSPITNRIVQLNNMDIEIRRVSIGLSCLMGYVKRFFKRNKVEAKNIST